MKDEGKERAQDPARRLSRSRVRLGLMTLGAAGLGTLAIHALLVEDVEDAAPAPARRAVSQDLARLGTPAPTTAAGSPDPAGQAAERVAPAPGPQAKDSPPAPAPRRLSEVLAQGARHAPGDLEVWVGDEALPPDVRYAALRRLEADAPADAVTAAIAVLDDPTSLVRLNAIAVLARSQDPRAKAALERVDARSQRLAHTLVARR